MVTHDLFKTESKIRTALSEIAGHGVALYGRRNHYSTEGLAAEWQRLTGKYATTVASLETEVEEIAAAVAKIEEYERSQMLPPLSIAGLTAAQELNVARVLSRPGFAKELHDVGPALRPYLSTVVATVLAEEIQARNKYASDEFLNGFLQQESTLLAETLEAAKYMPTAVGMLRAVVRQIREALDLEKSVTGHPVDSPARPGHHTRWLPLSTAYKPENGLKITSAGNFNV